MADGMERRDFLKVLGVAGAGASLAGCGTGQAEKLVPYVVPTEEVMPGVSTWYRTTCRECPAGCGMSVRTREGRAIKAEGNALSPISNGALCARGQASMHGLYNPDRVPQALANEGDSWLKTSWNDAEERLVEALRASEGRTVLLSHDATGTMDRLLDEWSDAFGVERVRFESFGWEPIRAANQLLFGRDAVPVHDFANADVVATFGADFLETWLSPVDYSRGFSQGHAYSEENGDRGRLISVAPHQSLTDMNSDEWLAIRPGTEHLVALAMAKQIVDDGRGDAGDAAPFLEAVDIAAAAEASGVDEERIVHAAREFANGGRSLAVGPGVESTHGAATAVAASVALLNYVAGNIGQTVQFSREEEGAAGGSYRELRDLIERMQAGEVDTLLLYGPNPLYGVPAADELTDAFEQVPFIASFSPYLDETSQHADLLLPDHHFLEAWDDYVPRTGVYSLIQPVMEPVFETKQTGDVLLSAARRAGVSLPSQATSYHEYLRESWARDVYPQAETDQSFDAWWREALQLGVVVADVPEPEVVLSADGLAQLDFEIPQFSGDEDGFYFVVYPSYRFYDGRLANRPWLQELPDPVSKISWTSWVEVNPAVAERLGLDVGSIVEVETDRGELRLPVWIHPGTREDVIAVQLGQGHDEFGRYAEDRGVNPVRLLDPIVEEPSGALVWQQTRAALQPTGEWTRLPYTAGNETQAGRDVAKAVALEELHEAGATGHEAEPAAAGAAHESGERLEGEGGHGEEHGWPHQTEVQELQAVGGFAPMTVESGPGDYPPPETYYGSYTEEEPRWGMSIDLDRCTGCSACVTACYAENNIGIVGPEEISKGRILSWLRIERYFDEDAEAAEAHATNTRFLPMLCQHCGNAPCEPVCPVYAAYHTPDGLNAQVYNRCVGTRYCANNCPYKVRYFNWFTWEWPEPMNWQLNPDVTVREKGVMEKCTFCVQRIRSTQRYAYAEGHGVADGDIVPACAQTCPANAITFGNIDDPTWRVSQIAESERAYRVLEHLNTQSGIVYLKKVVTESSEA